MIKIKTKNVYGITNKKSKIERNIIYNMSNFMESLFTIH